MVIATRAAKTKQRVPAGSMCSIPTHQKAIGPDRWQETCPSSTSALHALGADGMRRQRWSALRYRPLLAELGAADGSRGTWGRATCQVAAFGAEEGPRHSRQLHRQLFSAPQPTTSEPRPVNRA